MTENENGWISYVVFLSLRVESTATWRCVSSKQVNTDVDDEHIVHD